METYNSRLHIDSGKQNYTDSDGDGDGDGHGAGDGDRCVEVMVNTFCLQEVGH